jgi:hypothetical protein
MKRLGVVWVRVYVSTDEISTGLDSATITDAMQVFRSNVDVFKTTALVSLLQPPPEVRLSLLRCFLLSVFCFLYCLVASFSLCFSVCCLLSAVCCLLSAVCCLLSAVCCLLSAVCCLL